MAQVDENGRKYTPTKKAYKNSDFINSSQVRLHHHGRFYTVVKSMVLYCSQVNGYILQSSQWLYTVVKSMVIYCSQVNGSILKSSLKKRIIEYQ